MTRRQNGGLGRKTSCLALLVALVATACGASAEEQLAREIHPAIMATSYGDDPVATCATEALLADVGVASLGADGVTPEQLQADPTILQTYIEESETAPEIVADCLDAQQNFGEAFADWFEEPDSAECAQQEVDEDRAVDHAVAIVRGEEPEIDASTDSELVLECLGETIAADFQGLPSVEDIADPLATTLADTRPFSEDEAACVAAAVTDLGPLRLDELEITPDSVKKSFSTRGLDMEDAEFDAIQADLLECVDAAEKLSTRVFASWPELSECLAAGLTGADLREWASAELINARSLRVNAETNPAAIAECADARDLAVFGDLVSSADESKVVSIGRNNMLGRSDGPLIDRIFDHEYQCMGRALLSELSGEDIDRLDVLFYSADSEASLDALYADPNYLDYLVALVNGRSTCRSTEGLIQDAFDLLGFSDETMSCIHETMTTEEIRASFNDGHFAIDVSKVEPLVSAADYYRSTDARDVAIEECASASEMGRWNGDEADDSVSALRSVSSVDPRSFIPGPVGQFAGTDDA